MADKPFKFSADGSVLTIFNSYKYPKSWFRPVLQEIKDAYPDMKIFERSMCSLVNEWATHNALYALGYQRERTKDVDLDNPCDHPEWMYDIIGNLVWIFLK